MLVYVLVSLQGELFKQTAPGGINNELTKTLTCNKENGGGKNGTYCSCVHTVLLCINDDKILALFCKPLRCSVAVEWRWQHLLRVCDNICKRGTGGYS